MERLFKILYLLLNTPKITAPQLAERLEVSTRTIYRDIDRLSVLGIPVYTTRGKEGGISLDPDFILGHSFLSETEQQTLLSAIQNYSTTGEKQSQDVLEKLTGLFRKQPQNWIQVDVSNRGTSVLFEEVKDAILRQEKIQFQYYNTAGELSTRIVCPVMLYFKTRHWYLWAYCDQAEEYRLFRLSRIRSFRNRKERFSALPTAPPPRLEFGQDLPSVRVVLLIDGSLSYRVLDEFETGEIVWLKNGTIQVTQDFPENDWLYGYLLSFGGKLQVVSPSSLGEKLLQEAKKIQEIYQK